MASDFSIRHAAHIVKSGGIIAYPTDTIYGLGCNPYDQDAVARLNSIKQRPAHKQFILLAANIDQVKPFVVINKEQESLVTENDEPTSWVIEASKDAPAWLNNLDNTITVRLSKNDDVQRLCCALGHAIISTSANLSGKTPAQNALQLHQSLHHTLDKIVATNKKLNAKPSKIIRLCDNHVLRQ